MGIISGWKAKYTFRRVSRSTVGRSAYRIGCQDLLSAIADRLIICSEPEATRAIEVSVGTDTLPSPFPPCLPLPQV